MESCFHRLGNRWCFGLFFSNSSDGLAVDPHMWQCVVDDYAFTQVFCYSVAIEDPFVSFLDLFWRMGHDRKYHLNCGVVCTRLSGCQSSDCAFHALDFGGMIQEDKVSW